MTPYYDEAGITIYHGDCREILPALAGSGVSLIVADPPYNRVLSVDWDNQWQNINDYLSWFREIAKACRDCIAGNGSIYTFCAPQMSRHVEGVISEFFSVIGSIVWDKGDSRKGAAGSGIDVESLRTYWHSSTERCVFAENLDAERMIRAALGEHGYWQACEAAKKRIFGEYLKAEFARAGVTNKQIAALFPSKTGGITGCVSNWLLGFNVPTSEQYLILRQYLNDHGGEYLRREYEDLRREYEDLRREYEDLRREYEDLRRPFYLTEQDQWSDVWKFKVEKNRVHPSQKPLSMLAQIVRVSSRTGNLILDPLMGSGTTLRAAKELGRKAIGIEREERYCEMAAKRLAQEVLPLGNTPAIAHGAPALHLGLGGG